MMSDGVVRVQSRQFLQPPPSITITTVATAASVVQSSTSGMGRGSLGRRRASAFVRRVSMAIPTLTADPVPFSAVSNSVTVMKSALILVGPRHKRIRFSSLFLKLFHITGLTYSVWLLSMV
ncbi:unnamed protein product [Angiostrongylus costaricensis]|uniref:Uncharacterized protein n=1 Tax=Angiostrongylus costaricensis TaxID=334426 RepID=A0A0R3PTD2_ANGCS|nr:unnamed protein product [Angiostrongylus costaricensis]